MHDTIVEGDDATRNLGKKERKIEGNSDKERAYDDQGHHKVVAVFVVGIWGAHKTESTMGHRPRAT